MPASLSNWTAASISDLSGCSAIVTGADSGTGFHTALELARNGAEVTLAVRDEQKGLAAAGRIRREVPGALISLERLDLADLASVRRFARTYLAHHPSLHLLINNASIVATPERQSTVDGFEMQIGTMHFGHYALTGLLWPLLSKTARARVVTISSIVHRLGRIDFDDLDATKHYSRASIYAGAKLANLLFGLELHRRCADAGISVRSVIAHPGAMAAQPRGAGAHAEDAAPSAARLLGTLAPRLFQRPDLGAIPSLYAATALDAESGGYYGPSGFMEFGGNHPRRARMGRRALNRAAAKRLWDVSAARTDIHFL